MPVAEPRRDACESRLEAVLAEIATLGHKLDATNIMATANRLVEIGEGV